MEKEKTTQIKKKIMSINRQGIDRLLSYLQYSGYFNSPSSCRFHGAHEAGLLDHSISVFNTFTKLIEISKIEIPKESIIVAAFFHDVCKIGKYELRSGRYCVNRSSPEGHSLLSLERIKRYIFLTVLEQTMIKFHMGMYGTHEFARSVGYGKGEYSLFELTQCYNKCKISKLFYFSDDVSAQFLEK